MLMLVHRVRVSARLRRPSHLTSSASSSLHHFSSSSNAKPSVLDGPEGLMQFANRSVERVTTQMERYREHSVFPPSNWMLHNYLLFTKLQLPTNTEIDAVDFLNGARFACDFAVNTMYSTEFVNFATGAISESPAAEKMKSGLSETCYDAFLFAMKQTSKTGNRFTLKQLDINGVYLYDVQWDRMSLAELKQEEALEAYNRAQVVELEKQEEKEGKVEDTEKVVVNPMEDISPEDHATMIERLRLDVQLDAVEHLEVVTAEAADQLLEKNSSAVWRFESLVTQPEDVDWRIVSVL
ncbi:hypothetical protein PC129_g11664 [Phytophthora cactorum]|uniref:Uncharacterized protein n=2 Tax=Phytophthora cactorum TaxID=29920 RepID=A0A8T1CG23_9STRA|nr:hypothetical protein Pcac1_g11538 [Phytophthora cactorum]KAG2810221.1 hypothetical protein PC112_g16147 [Phytophthora cactorum]KAG2813479.1 hypothetical protein PC111_g14376 [Phytophthora cactorum]KAG2854180.1 hypothetical protein PC113_g13539 [Phytophthora cactorum]KAG2891326.1 hypothetical protein PC114_g17053 [Phytophthora cactorum]